MTADPSSALTTSVFALERQPSVRATLLLLFAILIVAGCAFYRGATSASELITTPDEVEYVSGAVSLAGGHGYRIDVAGRRLPSQYPPAFSVVLSPLYRLVPGKLGVGIYVELAFGLAAVTIAFWIGYRLEGPVAAALAALAVTVHPSISASARVIMSDIPSLALGLLVLALLIESDGHRARGIMAAAVVGALAAMLRPFNAFLLLPVLYTAVRRPAPRRNWLGVLAFTVGAAAVPVGLTMLYNYRTFGDPTRDGYKFWVAVPYDYLYLEFSPKYLPRNLALLKERTVSLTVFAGVLAFGYAVLQRLPRTRQPWKQFTRFVVFGPLPMSMAYAVYYFPTHRMHLPLLAVMCIAAACVVVEVARHLPLALARAAVAVAVAGMVVVGFYGRHLVIEPSHRRNGAAAIHAIVPPGSTVIATLDPVYFSLAADPSDSLHYVPLAGSTPIAAFVMTPHRVAHPVPAPVSDADMQCPGVLRGGGHLLFETYAVDDPTRVLDAQRANRRVFLDLSAAAKDDPAPARILRQFSWRVVNESTGLYELVDPIATPSKR